MGRFIRSCGSEFFKYVSKFNSYGVNGYVLLQLQGPNDLEDVIKKQEHREFIFKTFQDTRQGTWKRARMFGVAEENVPEAFLVLHFFCFSLRFFKKNLI